MVLPTDPRRPFGAVITAMVTPMTPEGAVDLDAAARLAVHLADHGHDGLVINGTTGESATVDDDEKIEVLRAVVDAVGDRLCVIAGAGTNDTRHSVRLAREAAEAGADGLLVVTPYYNKPPQAGLVRHFTAVADATDLPVMLYDIPGRSVIPIAADTLDALAAHPNVVAMKDAVGDLYEASWGMARTGLAWYSGEDGLNFPFLSIGAAGVVSVVGHVAGDRWAAMVAALDAGDLVGARRIHEATLPAVRGIMTRTQGAIMAKAALAMTGVIPSDAVRLPLVPATDEQRALLRADLLEAGLLT